MSDVLEGLAKKVFLCGPDGPNGVGTFVVGSVKSVYYASKGDGANAAGAAAGIWGGLSGAVLGICVGGPLGAFVGGTLGGDWPPREPRVWLRRIHQSNPTRMAEQELTIKIWSYTKSKSTGISWGNTAVILQLDDREIDHSEWDIRTIDGVGRLVWLYEGHAYIASFDLQKPAEAIIHHWVSPTMCDSEFTRLPNGNIKEWNPQKRETWEWIREHWTPEPTMGSSANHTDELNI